MTVLLHQRYKYVQKNDNDKLVNFCKEGNIMDREGAHLAVR